MPEGFGKKDRAVRRQVGKFIFPTFQQNTRFFAAVFSDFEVNRMNPPRSEGRPAPPNSNKDAKDQTKIADEAFPAAKDYGHRRLAKTSHPRVV